MIISSLYKVKGKEYDDELPQEQNLPFLEASIITASIMQPIAHNYWPFQITVDYSQLRTASSEAYNTVVCCIPVNWMLINANLPRDGYYPITRE